MPDGREDETDSSFFYMWRDSPRYMSLFLSEHRKPETIFVKAYEQHPNTAIDITRLELRQALFEPCDIVWFVFCHDDLLLCEAERLEDLPTSTPGGSALLLKNPINGPQMIAHMLSV